MAETKACKRCGAVIPPARLKALPDTVLCVKCSEEIGGDYETIAVAENLAKASSLKKNYGSW
ncbi:MAG: TraR/DksA C4-type zinc finger protein, partial [Blastocatellia bacterium]